MKNTNVNFGKEEFKAVYEKLAGNIDLMRSLVEMQRENEFDISERKAHQTAEELIKLVAGYESFESLLNEDTEQVLTECFKAAAEFNEEQRMFILHQAYFGLKLFQDAELIAKLDTEQSGGEMFKEYYERCSKDESITAERLEADIRAQVGNIHVTPAMLRRMADNAKDSQNVLAASAALGSDALDLKCIVAMDLYLRNKGRGMTLQDAVVAACSQVELQAVADAYAKGMITEARAYEYIQKISTAILLAGAILTLWLSLNLGIPMVKVLMKHSIPLVLILGSMALDIFSAKLARRIGMIVAGCELTVPVKESEASQALDDLADYLQDNTTESATESVKLENPEEEEMVDIQETRPVLLQ